MSGSDELFDTAKPAGPFAAALPLARAVGTRNLLIIIITMPVVFLFVVMAVIAVAGTPERRAERAAARSSGTLEQPALYRGALTPSLAAATLPEAAAPLVLPEGARIAAMALDGDRLAIRIESAQGGEIAIYDLATGARVQTIPVQAGNGL